MKPALILALTLSATAGDAVAQEALDRLLPVRGFCIAAPRPEGIDAFVGFIEGELAPRSVNTLVLRVDDNYRFASHPDLGDPKGLTRADVGRIVAACKASKIRVIPQYNLLGHQSWSSRTNRLLRVHPEFDETPWVAMPENYKWPNPDKLYCKSYCPLHPGVHAVVFALVDELCEAFEADAFHAGLDEVFYIGEAKCPRCGGKDKAELFAGEVTRIRDHLKEKNRRMWMWGDRLLDGEAAGLGEWEASTNGTARAVDLIPRDVVVCDWHYERPDPTAVYFAMKGLDVVTCPWKKPSVATAQLEETVGWREHASPAMRKHFLGMLQTSWSGAESFLDEFRGKKPPAKADRSESGCFRALFEGVGALKAR